MPNAIQTVNYRVITNAAASKLAQKEVYTGRVDIKETYDLDAVAMRMVEGGCTSKVMTIKTVLTDFADLVGRLVAEGRAVNISGLVRFAPAVRGTFESLDAAWNSTENRVVVNASAGAAMRMAAANSSVTRSETLHLPKLVQLIDMVKETINTVTSEGSFVVVGERLEWDLDAADEGWFLRFNGEEKRCEVIEQSPMGESVILKTDFAFTQAGDPLELFLRTRVNGVLHSVKMEQAITTAM